MTPWPGGGPPSAAAARIHRAAGAPKPVSSLNAGQRCLDAGKRSLNAGKRWLNAGQPAAFPATAAAMLG